MEYSSYTPELWLENKERYEQAFEDEDAWHSIPLINVNELHHFKDNCLVRFHGMVQDMYNPEYYFEKYEVENESTKEKRIKCGKYRDTTDLSDNEIIHFESKNNITCERQTLVMITYPGLNEWVLNIETEHHKIVSSNSNRSETVVNESLKRSIDEEMEVVNTADTTENKRLRSNDNKEESKSVVSRDHLLNFPIPGREGKSCIVKIYDNPDTFKLNEMAHILGFLSVDPLLTEMNYHNSEHDNQMEIQTHNPPPSLVPRLHCVLFKKITYYNPLLKSIPEITVGSEVIVNLFKELSILLTQLLFGDKLAAEYLICHLISSVYMRKDLMALGKFSLNLSNIPNTLASYGEQLYEFLQLLVPKSHYLPMTLDNMNDLSFIPKKDYECNRLTSGLLQLSNNTHLILDETKLQPGQLSSSGCSGISALAQTIKTQRVNYDFNYYKMEFDCDIPVLILSEGTSLLPSDFLVPLQLDAHGVNTFTEILDAAKQFLKSDLLNKLRVYLTKMRHSTYTLSNNVLQLVQNEFVQMRQNDSKISAEDLHQLLVLARLICLSQGGKSLDEAGWKIACQMEQERKIRVANRPTRK